MPEEAYPGAEEGVRQGERGKIRGRLPSKRRVNLALVTQKRSYKGLLPLVLLALIALGGVFVQNAILNRFQALREARERLEAVSTQFDGMEEALLAYDQVREVYPHITWSDMTPEENGWVDPLDAAELMERVVSPVCHQSAWSMSGNSISLTLSGVSLQEILDLVTRLREEPMVESCSLHGGSRASNTYGAAADVVSTVVLQFKSGDNRNTWNTGYETELRDLLTGLRGSAGEEQSGEAGDRLP